MTFDELRAAYPALGFAVYAYEPGGGVVLEVIDGQSVFTFRGLTLAAAVAAAFPKAPEPEPPAQDLFG